MIFVKIGNDYIHNFYLEIEISDYSRITYGKNSLLVGYHNQQTVNGIPILNSDITVTINAETGLIINESLLTMNDFNKVETSDILKADETTKKNNLIKAIKYYY